MVGFIDSVENILGYLFTIYKFVRISGSGQLHRQINSLTVELEHMRTFFIYTTHWKGADEDLLHDHSLVSDFEATISKVLSVIGDDNIRKSHRTLLNFINDSLLPELLKIKAFRPRIKQAYDCILKHYSFQSNSHMSSYDFWDQFYDSVRDNIHEGPMAKANLLLKEHLKALGRNVGLIGLFVKYVASQVPNHHATKSLLTHLGFIIVRAAHLSYLCWADDMDEKASQEMIVIIHDVQKKLKPNTSDVIKMYLTVLLEASKAEKWPEIISPEVSNSSKTRKTVIAERMANNFLDILVPFPYQHPRRSSTSGALLCKQESPAKKPSIEMDGLETLCQGLQSLIVFLIGAPHLNKEDMEAILIDLTKVCIEVECLSYSLKETVSGETDLALFKILEKMELLKVEIMLLKLLNQEGCFLLKDQIDSLHKGVAFLGTLLEQLGINERRELMWMQIESTARETSSLCLSLHSKEVAEETVKDGIFDLLEKIKLFKLGTFLMELLNTDSSLMVPLKDQIESLYNALIFLRTFMMGPLDEKGKQILPRARSVARQAASFYCSFHACEITEELVSRLSLSLQDLLKDIMLVKVEISEIYQQVRISLQSNFPKTNGLGFLDFLLGNLKDFMTSDTFCLETSQNQNAEPVFFVKHHIKFLYNEIKILRSFFKEKVREFNEQLELKDLPLHIMNVAYESEYLIDTFMIKDCMLWYHVIWLTDLVEEIKLVKFQVSKIFEKEVCDMRIHNVCQTSRRSTLSPGSARYDGFFVDLRDQAELLVNRLKRGSLQREVVSIVGMPGIGKTTLARQLYTEPSVLYHFHIRAWCWISQVYEKRKLLIDILSEINIGNIDNFHEMSEEDLEVELYQCLKGRRYLIVLDDMWDIEVWNDLERSLPNDENGSRILITSRLHGVALNAHGSFHPLRLLTDDESWTLLQKKVFHMDDCPEELLKVGKQIAKGCKGLPLAVVAIAGLLHRTNKEEDWWKQVAENLNSLIAEDPQTRCMDILELSYNHLPDYLKPCFLYLGAFIDDKEILVRKLKWLWIAEGFVQTTFLESLEDVAEGYMMDLIDRSLVVVVKRRSKGNGTKTCTVHSIIRDFCLARSKEESFLQLNNRYDELFAFSSEVDYGVDADYYPWNSVFYEKYRLSICSKRKHFISLKPSGTSVRSLLFFAISDMYPRCPYDVSFISSNFKLLRVLDLECINMGHSFPKGIELLVHLRYLSLSGDIDSVPSSIANLQKLETFLLKGLKGKVTLPDTIWKMTRLRHIHVNCHTAFSLPDDMLEGFCRLGNLVTFSSPFLSKGKDSEKIVRMLPSLQRLRCIFSQSQDDSGKYNGFPVLDFLMNLESLSIFFSGRKPYPSEFNLPLNLKKLTLSNFHLPWDLISEVGRLPSLEVLKLLSQAFEGKTWDMREGEFLKLKFLKLDTLNIAHWSASSDHLPMLEHLVLQSCKHLEEVPLDFANIPTLQMIEMKFCRSSAEESVKRLKEEQLDMGNEELKVVINKKVGF